MTLPFFIIGCGKSKRPTGSTAGELYTGQLFQCALAYARLYASDDRILVMSAKHGLLQLDTQVEPYDVTIHNTDSKVLTHTLENQIPWMVPRVMWASEITVLAGAPYVQTLSVAWLLARDEAPGFKCPLRGMGLGYRLQWFKKELEEVAYA